MDWRDSCVDEISKHHCFFSALHRQRIMELFEMVQCEPFLTKEIAKCIFLAAWQRPSTDEMAGIFQKLIDEEAMELLIETSEGLQITFHMAFDCIPQERQFEAIDWLVEHGVDRILTHGGDANAPIEANFDHLKKLIAYADGRLIILPGGKIDYKNAEHVAKELGVNEVHGTKIVSFD